MTKSSSLLPRMAVLIAAGLFAAACGNNPHPKPLREVDDDGTPWAVRYQVLPEEPKSFDPQVQYDQMSRRVIEPVYDTLLEYHPLKTDPYEVMPGMLETLPVKEPQSDGGVHYLCKLKAGIMYHDDPCFPGGKGREVVAEDVKFAFQRICDPRVGSPFVGPLGEFIAGMTEAHEAASKTGTFDYSAPFAGVEVLDRYSFRINLKKPFPQMVYYMAMHCTTPVAREAVEYYDGKEHDGVLRPDFKKFHAVGTGAFRIVEYIPRQRIRLERVPGYNTVRFPTDSFPPEKAEWLQQFAGKQLPFIDEINFTIIRENIPIFVLTRQGYMDAMAANKDSFAALLTAERELSQKYRDRGLMLEKDADPSTFWISFNLEDPLLGSNKKLRQALACSYDAHTYSGIFFSGVSPVATQVIPPGIYGYDKSWKNPYAYNLEKAKQLLAEAGYPNGRDAQGRQLQLTLESVASGSEDRQRSEFDQRCFEALGIKVKVNENNFGQLLQKLDNGNFQIASGTGWGADYPDPENFFFLFYSKNVPPYGKNSSRYNNPEFDRLHEQMASMDNSPERLEIIRKMTTMLAEDCPIILTFNKQYYSVVQPWAPRTHSNPMLEGGLKYQIVDPVMRAQKQREWNEKPMWPIAVLVGLVTGATVYAVRLNRRRNV